MAALCAGAIAVEVVVSPLVIDVFAGEVIAASALSDGPPLVTNALLVILAFEGDCRCFSSLSNSVTRVSKLCTTSRNCFTSSADAGAALFACARPTGHHASS